MDAVSQSPAVGRFVGIVPDLLTAAFCAALWVSPFMFGVDAVKGVILAMILEFILIHATAFLMSIAFATDRTRAGRIVSSLSLTAFYLLLVASFSALFRSWWPIVVFLWLSVSKIAWVLSDPREREAERRRQSDAWMFSVAAYIVTVVAGVVLPLPALGLTPEAVARLGLPGTGQWIEHPQAALFSMALYYLASAWYKWNSDPRGIVNLIRSSRSGG